MPDQPPTPSRVEELLRASARRRRAEFDGTEVGGRSEEEPQGAAMPAAMRQRLHEEILARRAGAATLRAESVRDRRLDSPRVGLFALFTARFWPRFALAAAVVAALLAVPFFWRAARLEKPSTANAVATRTTDARPAEPAAAPAATTTSAETAAVAAAAAPELQQAPPATVALASTSPAPPPPAIVAPSAPGAAATTSASAPVSREPPALADAASPTPAFAAASPSVTRAEPDAARSRPVEDQAVAAKPTARGDGGESGLRQSFARNETAATSRVNTASRRSGAAGAATKDSGAGSSGRPVAAASADDVLSNFRLEQTGDRVRIVDADGSVYTGEIQPLDTKARAATPRARATDTLAQSAATQAPAGTTASASGSKAAEDERAADSVTTQRGRFARNSGPAPAPAPARRAAAESQSRSAASSPGSGLTQAQTGVQQPAASADATRTEAPATVPQLAATTAGAAAFSFRATGANVSLHKPVVFEGTYYPALGPDQAPAAEANLELKKKQEPAASRARSATATREAQSRAATTAEDKPGDDETAAAVADAPRVIGRARVAGREVSVDASAVSP